MAENNYGPFQVVMKRKILMSRQKTPRKQKNRKLSLVHEYFTQMSTDFGSDVINHINNIDDLYRTIKDLLAYYMEFEMDNFLPIPKEHSNDITVSYPELNLFIWSLLLNRIELAKYFWRIGSFQTAGALIASILYKNMARHFGDSKHDFMETSK